MTSRRLPPFRFEDSLLYQFSVISSRVGNRIHAVYRERFKISPAAWRVLAHVAQLQPVTAKEIGRRAGMDSVNLSRAMSQLDELGFVNRSIDIEDRRRIVLELTKKGHAAYENLAPISVAAEQELIADLTAAERRALHALSRRMWERTMALYGDDPSGSTED